MTTWQSLFMLGAGLFVIAGAGLNWSFFMNHRRARPFVLVFGHNGARIFYFIFGLVFFIIGVLALLSSIGSDPA